MSAGHARRLAILLRSSTGNPAGFTRTWCNERAEQGRRKLYYFVHIGVIPRAPSRNASFEMDLGHEEVKPNLKMPSAETQVSGRTLPSGSQKPAAGQRTEGEPTTSHAPNASLKVPSRQQTPERSISHALSEDGGPILEGELLEKPNGWKVLQDHPFWLGDVEQVSIDTGTQTLNEDHTCKARAIVQ